MIRSAVIGEGWRTDIFYVEEHCRNPEDIVKEYSYTLQHVRYIRERMFGKFTSEPIERAELLDADKEKITQYLSRLIRLDCDFPGWASFWDSIKENLVCDWTTPGVYKSLSSCGVTALVNFSQCHALLQQESLKSHPSWKIILHRFEHEITDKILQFRHDLSVVSKLG